MAAQLSVIIPTYNRKDILLKTLEGYKLQTATDEILEVLVVDDGSTDETGEAVKQFASSAPFLIQVLRQQNSGLAAARNLGIQAAKGELLLFGDDDIIPTPAMVAEHLDWNRKYPAPSDAVLGLVVWAPQLNPTPFMRWFGLKGGLFSFGQLRGGSDVAATCCYFCNTSVKKRFLLENAMFDEEFKSYGYEDTELGHRLLKKGFRLFYNPQAVGHHYKRMSVADIRRRAELISAAQQTLWAKAPELRANRKEPAGHRMLKALAKFFAPALAPFAFVLESRIPLPQSFYRVFYFLISTVWVKQGALNH